MGKIKVFKKEYGIEEETLGEEDFYTTYDVNLIRIDPTSMPVFQILRKIDMKEINLEPEFQRNLIWSEIQQSRLIESILIKIPLPSFYLDATNDDNWLIVDGLQRLNTLYRFSKDRLKLKSLQFIAKDIEGKVFSQLPRYMQRRIEETHLFLNIIKPETPLEAKFAIFVRLNTGGNALNAQEIRHCIYQGKSTGLLKELALSKEFKEATSASISPKRMADRECILRFLAFYLTDYNNYQINDLNGFLGKTMKKINHMKDKEIIELKQVFKDAMLRSEMVFGKYAFRKLTKKDDKPNPINKALFETWAVCLLKFPLMSVSERRDTILDNFIKTMNEDKYFVEAISQGTGDVNKVKIRFNTVKNIIEEAIK